MQFADCVRVIKQLWRRSVSASECWYRTVNYHPADVLALSRDPVLALSLHWAVRSPLRSLPGTYSASCDLDIIEEWLRVLGRMAFCLDYPANSFWLHSDYVFFFFAAEEVAPHCVHGACCQEDRHHCVSLPVILNLIVWLMCYLLGLSPGTLLGSSFVLSADEVRRYAMCFPIMLWDRSFSSPSLFLIVIPIFLMGFPVGKGCSTPSLTEPGFFYS